MLRVTAGLGRGRQFLMSIALTVGLTQSELKALDRGRGDASRR